MTRYDLPVREPSTMRETVWSSTGLALESDDQMIALCQIRQYLGPGAASGCGRLPGNDRSPNRVLRYCGPICLAEHELTRRAAELECDVMPAHRRLHLSTDRATIEGGPREMDCAIETRMISKLVLDPALGR